MTGSQINTNNLILISASLVGWTITDLIMCDSAWKVQVPGYAKFWEIKTVRRTWLWLLAGIMRHPGALMRASGSEASMGGGIKDPVTSRRRSRLLSFIDSRSSKCTCCAALNIFVAHGHDQLVLNFSFLYSQGKLPNWLTSASSWQLSIRIHFQLLQGQRLLCPERSS